jgi:hypothetical protein
MTSAKGGYLEVEALLDDPLPDVGELPPVV